LIYWQAAPPGASIYTKPNIFFPLCFTTQFRPMSGVGELATAPRVRIAWGPPAGVDGQHPHGSEEDFMGLTVYTGPVSWDQVPHCRVPPAIEFGVLQGYTLAHFALLMRTPKEILAFGLKDFLRPDAIALGVGYKDKRGQNAVAFDLTKPKKDKADAIAFVANSSKVGRAFDRLAFGVEAEMRSGRGRGIIAFAAGAGGVSQKGKDILAFGANYKMKGVGVDRLAFLCVAEPPTLLRGGDIIAFGAQGGDGMGTGNIIAFNASLGPLVDGHCPIALSCSRGSNNVHITDNASDMNINGMFLPIAGSQFSSPANTNVFTIKDSHGVTLPSSCIVVDQAGQNVIVLLTKPPGANLGAVYAQCSNTSGDSGAPVRVATFVNMNAQWIDTFNDDDAKPLNQHHADFSYESDAYTNIADGLIIKGAGVGLDGGGGTGISKFMNNAAPGIAFFDMLLNHTTGANVGIGIDDQFGGGLFAVAILNNDDTVYLHGTDDSPRAAFTPNTWHRFTYERYQGYAAWSINGISTFAGVQFTPFMYYYLQMDRGAGGPAINYITTLRVENNT
jgi:hypothetical protein